MLWIAAIVINSLVNTTKEYSRNELATMKLVEIKADTLNHVNY